MSKQVTKTIEDDELLVAFAVKEADVPKLAEAICVMNNYQGLVDNPDFLINKPESPTNLRMIVNPVDPKEFAMQWIIKMAYEQIAAYKRREEEILLAKQREEERLTTSIGAKPVI